MRSKKAMINFLASVVELIIATVTSFIVPHYIIHAFGSSVNGLISSITQFLSYIALIESGIGAIGRTSLYKPLADGDTGMLSRNVKALDNFYKKVSYAFIGYMAVLAVLFPLLVNQEFSWGYTATMIVILAFSTFIQYYFGITSQTVIQADQRKSIPSLLQALTLLLNMIFTVVLIRMGASAHVVKIGSAVAFAIRPVVLYMYVAKHYSIDKKAVPNNDILKQRWDGLAQHIAYFIHKNTGIAVLTILTNVKEVSVYSVYMLAVAGCSKVVNVFSSSLEPAFGNMIAKGEKDTLRDRVWLCSTLTVQVAVVLFSTAVIIITPFIELYTRGVTDANYLRPAFGVVLLIAEAMYCIRMPYQSVVYAAGHFRQTRNGALGEAALNIVLSVILVHFFGLIGVAIGAFVSMVFRTSQYVWYYHVHLLGEREGLKKELKRIVVSLVEIAGIALFAALIPAAPSGSYMGWILGSLGVGVGCSAVVLLVSLVFYRKELRDLAGFMKRVLKRRK
ncbi:MAG: polysaccharide biosynthesis C-terminal domain-containing protein [Clostridia bacterium]|nr:polysaccharide biosynthesis C-terminal domain-containing protein [Clostridia bacterium]